MKPRPKKPKPDVERGATYARGGEEKMFKEQAAGPAKAGVTGTPQNPAPGAKRASGGARTPAVGGLSMPVGALMEEFRLSIGRRLTGFSVVRDERYPSMWRVRSPDGSLSDMVNLTRAKEAALSWARGRGVNGTRAVVRWDVREIPSEGGYGAKSAPAPTDERVAA